MIELSSDSIGFFRPTFSNAELRTFMFEWAVLLYSLFSVLMNYEVIVATVTKGSIHEKKKAEFYEKVS